MNASELRIGNHILKNGVQSELTVELFLEYLRYTTPFDPIQLTEEWLVKFGFDNDQVLLVRGLIMKYSFTYQIIELIRYETLVDFEIEYVHQLQNLYFALTGEELTLQS